MSALDAQKRIWVQIAVNTGSSVYSNGDAINAGDDLGRILTQIAINTGGSGGLNQLNSLKHLLAQIAINVGGATYPNGDTINPMDSLGRIVAQVAYGTGGPLYENGNTINPRDDLNIILVQIALNTEGSSTTPSSLAFTTQPSGAVTGQPFTQQPVVAVRDSGGNVLASFTGNVTIAINSGSGVLSGTLTKAAVAGVATFTNLAIDTTGNFTLVASIATPPISVVSSSFAVAFDPDAQAFFTAASITDATEKSAVNQLVLDLKAASIWSKMIGLYPYVGSAETPHSFNLKNPATFQISWQGSTIHDANGWINNVNGFGLVAITSADLTANSFAFGFYNRTDTNDGSDDFKDATGGLFRSIFFSDNNWYSDNPFNGGAGRLVVAMGPPTRQGSFTASRTAANAIAAYRNGVSLATGAGAQGDISALTEFDLGGTGTNHQYAMHYFSSGLTAGEVANFYTAVQAFQTTLGRQV